MNFDLGVAVFFGNRSLVEIRRTSSGLLRVADFSSNQASGPAVHLCLLSRVAGGLVMAQFHLYDNQR
jgi:hypothetical protein